MLLSRFWYVVLGAARWGRRVRAISRLGHVQPRRARRHGRGAVLRQPGGRLVPAERRAPALGAAHPVRVGRRHREVPGEVQRLRGQGPGRSSRQSGRRATPNGRQRPAGVFLRRRVRGRPARPRRCASRLRAGQRDGRLRARRLPRRGRRAPRLHPRRHAGPRPNLPRGCSTGRVRSGQCACRSHRRCAHHRRPVRPRAVQSHQRRGRVLHQGRARGGRGTRGLRQEPDGSDRH